MEYIKYSFDDLLLGMKVYLRRVNSEMLLRVTVIDIGLHYAVFLFVNPSNTDISTIIQASTLLDGRIIEDSSGLELELSKITQ